MEKIAIVLMESFSAKLVLASVEDNNYFVYKDLEKEKLNLVLDPEADMFLKKNQIDETLKVLKNFRKICEMHKVNRVIAVATFLNNKRPKNVYSFFEEAFNTSGFRFSILSDEEQNLGVYNGIINSFDIPKALICHINAESVQLINYNRRTVIAQAVLPFGPLTLAEMFPLDADNKDKNLIAMQNYVNSELDKLEFLSQIEEEFAFIGNGPYYEDITKLVKKYKKYPLTLTNNYTFEQVDCEYVYNQVKAIDLDKTKKIKGTTETRADVFVASMIINNCVLNKAGKQTIVASTKGLIEGLMFTQIITESQEKPITDVLGYSMTSQGIHFDNENLKHNEQVYNLSLLLFKQLRVLHKLPRNYTKILRLASYMHDCGARIGYADHAKNGFNVLLGADICGVTHRELVLAGFAIAMHCGEDIPMTEYLKYHDLITDEDIAAVKKLGIILRLAEAFDRIKNNVIVDINCDILGDSVIMKTIAVGDNSYEVMKACECEKDFVKNFNKKIEIL